MKRRSHRSSTVALSNDARDLCRRWGVSPEDPAVHPIIKKADRIWQNWNASQRLWLMFAVESIVAAEKTRKRSGHLPPGSPDHPMLRICKLARDAFVLALRIDETFSGPRNAYRSGIDALVDSLLDFGSTLKGFAEGGTRLGRAVTAGLMIGGLKQHTPQYAGRISSALLAELVWICSGMRKDVLDESAVRRYVRELRSQRSDVVTSFWKAQSKLLDRVSRIETRQESAAFQLAFTHLCGIILPTGVTGKPHRS
jgi:hypothetical protein